MKSYDKVSLCRVARGQKLNIGESVAPPSTILTVKWVQKLQDDNLRSPREDLAFEKASGREWFQVKLQLGLDPLQTLTSNRINDKHKDRTMTFHLILKSFQDSDHLDLGFKLKRNSRGQRHLRVQITRTVRCHR